MNKLRSLALGAVIALTSIGMAHAEGTVGGAWKLTIGVTDDPCTLTLTPDATGIAGSVASGADCPANLQVAAWKTAGNGVELYTGSGDLVVQLKPHGDALVGTRFADGRKLALSR